MKLFIAGLFKSRRSRLDNRRLWRSASLFLLNPSSDGRYWRRIQPNHLVWA